MIARIGTTLDSHAAQWTGKYVRRNDFGALTDLTVCANLVACLENILRAMVCYSAISYSNAEIRTEIELQFRKERLPHDRTVGRRMDCLNLMLPASRAQSMRIHPVKHRAKRFGRVSGFCEYKMAYSCLSLVERGSQRSTRAALKSFSGKSFRHRSLHHLNPSCLSSSQPIRLSKYIMDQQVHDVEYPPNMLQGFGEANNAPLENTAPAQTAPQGGIKGKVASMMPSSRALVNWNSADKLADYEYIQWNPDLIRDRFSNQVTPDGKRYAWGVGICYIAFPISVAIPLVSKSVAHWAMYIRKVGEDVSRVAGSLSAARMKAHLILTDLSSIWSELGGQ